MSNIEYQTESNIQIECRISNIKLNLTFKSNVEYRISHSISHSNRMSNIEYQLCCRACLLEQYNTMRLSIKKRLPPHNKAGRKRSFYLIFSDFFYLVRKRYYFDFLLLSVAEQAGLWFTRSKFQNFDFLPLSITDLGPELQCLLRVKEDLS